MRRLLRIALATLAAGTALVLIVAAAVPIWLLLRVPAALAPPGALQPLRLTSEPTRGDAAHGQ